LEHGEPLREFRYDEVDFSPGLHQSQLEQTHSVLMSLDEDGLLRPFRMAAQQAAPGLDLGGWYSAPRFLGETFGQWISALSRYFAATRDEASRAKVERLIGLYSKTLEPSGRIFQLNGNPIYFHDKLTQGLSDAALFANSAVARDTLAKLMDCSGPVLDKKNSWLAAAASQSSSENYNFAETYFTAWQRSGDERFFEWARGDLGDGFCDRLSQGENILGGRHAYSHMNGLCGAAKAYLVLEEEKYLRAAVNGLSFAEQQSFATGAYGPGESFVPKKPDFRYPDRPPIPNPGESLLHEHHHFETGCGSYAHFKLTRYLLRITKDARYGDSMERVMYNCALGALPLNRFGKAFYQSNYHHHARKEYFDGYDGQYEDEWPCCSGTLTQLATDYRISTYLHDEHGIFVNLYIPSTLRWKREDVSVAIKQSGQYPLNDAIVFDVDASRPLRFAMRLRVPQWTREPVIRVNGKKLSHSTKAGFASIDREWRRGDRVELHLPRTLELKPVDDQHPDMVALTYGPIVLFAITDDTPKVTRSQLLAARQKAPGHEEWITDSAGGPLSFLPWWAITKGRTYFTYFSV
jgi:DUF1680 family protein